MTVTTSTRQPQLHSLFLPYSQTQIIYGVLLLAHLFFFGGGGGVYCQCLVVLNLPVATVATVWQVEMLANKLQTKRKKKGGGESPAGGSTNTRADHLLAMFSKLAPWCYCARMSSVKIGKYHKFPLLLLYLVFKGLMISFHRYCC